jgi:hypothetical protein
MTRRHAAAVGGSALLVFGLVAFGVVVALRVNPLSEAAVIGVVLTDDADPSQQTPLAGVDISGTVGRRVVNAKSDPSGFFRITLPITARLGRPVKLRFAREGYKAEDVSLVPSDALFVQRLKAIVRRANAQHTVGSNIRIRYTVKTTSFIDVGTVVRTFQVRNIGNEPCRGNAPCSPNGQWKAAAGELRLDAQEGNRFRNASVSCIAGPCPFTRIESEDLREDDRLFVVSALNWSDTTTFLVEADVVHNQITDMVRQSFAVEFNRSLTFSLPPTAGGPSIRAEVDGQDLVFPLGPDLILSWAQCSVKVDADRSQSYTCELMPQYRFH